MAPDYIGTDLDSDDRDDLDERLKKLQKKKELLEGATNTRQLFNFDKNGPFYQFG